MAMKSSKKPAGSKAKIPWYARFGKMLSTVENSSRRMASTDYWLVLVGSIALAVFGVIMVQSSASVEAIAKGRDGRVPPIGVPGLAFVAQRDQARTQRAIDRGLGMRNGA